MKACQKIRPSGSYAGKQGFSYLEGVSSESMGAERHLHALADHSARRAGQGAQARDA